jgi:hypothetical protein
MKKQETEDQDVVINPKVCYKDCEKKNTYFNQYSYLT